MNPICTSAPPGIRLEHAAPSAAPTRVTECLDEASWNEYVARNSAGSILHRAEWQAVYGVYRLPVLRLAAEREGNIVGILPLVWQKSLLFGNQLVSLPWFDAVNVLADDRSAWECLVSAARSAAHDRGSAVLQLRQTEPADLDCHVRTDKVLMRLKLDPDPEALWKGLSAKVRNQVRKAEKSDLAVESGGGELLDEFYAVYSKNMRDLGSPSHHRRIFSAVCEQFAESCRVHVVRRAGQAVGAGLTIANGRRLEIPWASSLREFNNLCVNHLMYWTILAGACRQGFDWFHFGRSSRDSGTYHFKKQWGAEEVPLYWYLLDGSGKPKTTVSAPQESFGWATKVWQKLPLALARRLGPYIIAKVP